MADDARRLVLDANIMISAVLGRSFPFLLEMVEGGARLFAPLHQLAETRHRLAARPNLTSQWVDAQMERLLVLVAPLHPALLVQHEARARLRLGERGAPDWPVVAATFALDAAAWTHDKDFFGSGVAVWSTRILRQAWVPADA